MDVKSAYQTLIMSSSKTKRNNSTTKHLINFAGTTIETTVTSNAAAVDKWVEDILTQHGSHPTVVGLDVEWRPHVFSSMSNKSATLQLCIANKCLILQLFYLVNDEIPLSLKSFLLNTNFTFVGIEVDDDVKKLTCEYGLECGATADIKVLAMKRWPGKYSRPGLKDLAFDVSGLKMTKEKHVCMSNWEARVLNDGQVEYACVDAYASYRVGLELISENLEMVQSFD
ncbi:Werner Syndrome-like exonuclease [Impatiens glandulifera]|uniref:Werner Syndrome-like exonuclease n=1 Tax=Impatiens glandulifera TaxID=253017 RepID=UPI001FB05599|nr:Werner Syndrome-like exonuclease [Impatiens glandulifera]